MGPTREDACAYKGVDYSDPKWGSYIPWNPTSPREAHENVFIRNNLPLMCRRPFPPLLCALGENKTVRGIRPQSGQYLHRWGAVVTL